MTCLSSPLLADGKEEEDEEEMQIKAAIEKEKTVYQVRKAAHTLSITDPFWSPRREAFLEGREEAGLTHVPCMTHV